MFLSDVGGAGVKKKKRKKIKKGEVENCGRVPSPWGDGREGGKEEGTEALPDVSGQHFFCVRERLAAVSKTFWQVRDGGKKRGTRGRSTWKYQHTLSDAGVERF